MASEQAEPAPHACLTVDLDSLRCYRDIHGLEPSTTNAADAAYRIGVRRLIDFFTAASVPATLFVVGRDAQHPAHAELLGEATDKGFELGNHTYSHFYDLPERSEQVQRDELSRAEDAIEAAGGARPFGYRAPGYHIAPNILEVVRSRGYLYDSSVFPCPPYYAAKGAIMAWQRLRSRPSRSAMTPVSNLLAPIGAYRPAPDRLWKHDPNSPMPIEIPMCLVPGVRFPVIGTSLHLMGQGGFDAVFPLLKSTYKRIFQLEFHAIDFMDADDLASNDPSSAALTAAQPDLRIPWPQKRALYAHVIARLRETYQFSTLEDAVGDLNL
jgi:peptidoglycan/xylan/chitin deacetylase (PgdA/CDA1 family)